MWKRKRKRKKCVVNPSKASLWKQRYPLQTQESLGCTCLSSGVHLLWVSNYNDMWSGSLFFKVEKEEILINKSITVLISNKRNFSPEKREQFYLFSVKCTKHYCKCFHVFYYLRVPTQWGGRYFPHVEIEVWDVNLSWVKVKLFYL